MAGIVEYMSDFQYLLVNCMNDQLITPSETEDLTVTGESNFKLIYKNIHSTWSECEHIGS